MIVEQGQCIRHPAGMQGVAHGHEILGRQTELRVFPAARRPLSRPLGEQADPRPDHRDHADLVGHREDLVEFLELLDDKDHLLAELQSDEGGPDELVVLVPVADDEALRIGVDGERRDHLGLAPGLDPEVVGKPCVDDFLHDLAELVHLDREDTSVLVAVAAFGDGSGEGLVDPADAVAKKIMAPDKQWEAQSASTGLGYQFHEIDLTAGTAKGAHHGVSLVIDGHISLGPSLHIVEGGIGGNDGFGRDFGHLGRKTRGIGLTKRGSRGDRLL